MTDLVPLYRCRLCKARLFAKDAPGHVQRHLRRGEQSRVAQLCDVPLLELAQVELYWRRLFLRGRRDTCPTPGLVIRLHHQKQPGKVYGARF